MSHGEVYSKPTDAADYVCMETYERVVRERDEAQRDAAKSDDERPYWLWRAMLSFAAKVECQRYKGNGNIECTETSDCITEWCVPCAAKAFLQEIQIKERVAELGREKG